MRNERTPRGLAETSFTTGYRLASLPRRWRLADILYPLACVLAFAAIGVLLAWRG